MQSQPRYYKNDGKLVSELDPHQELLASLERINTYNPPVATCSTGWTFNGVLKGPTGIAYLFYRLSQLYPDLEFKQQSLLEWAEAYLALGNHVKKADPDPGHCGIANETLAHLACSAVILNDESLAKQICGYETLINGADNGSNEWLYGRAGYLFFLRMCKGHFMGSKHAATLTKINETITGTIGRIVKVPLPWKWHGKEYLGAAHGTIGIIAQCIMSDPSTASSFTEVLKQTLSMQFSSCNFPSSSPPHSDELVQFCHGAPGFIISLSAIKEHYPTDKDFTKDIEEAIGKAQDTVWARGLLTKDPCLCHGIAGNALSFYDQERRDVFLSWMTSDVLEKNNWLKEAGHTDKFASLYGGEAGRVWIWALADKGLGSKGGCIGFSDV